VISKEYPTTPPHKVDHQRGNQRGSS
jgi:hypothetical protein